MISVERFRARLWPCLGLALILPVLAAGCGRDLAPQDEDSVVYEGGPRSHGVNPRAGTIFGGASVEGIASGEFLRERSGDALPVNKFLWQAALDTLDFLPLISTDPFTGVIATDWAGTAEAPNERLKVTTYLTKPQLEASSLRVAVYRQIRDAQGGWQAAPVSPDTALRLENAILARARQLRIADLEGAAG